MGVSHPIEISISLPGRMTRWCYQINCQMSLSHERTIWMQLQQWKVYSAFFRLEVKLPKYHYNANKNVKYGIFMIIGNSLGPASSPHLLVLVALLAFSFALDDRYFHPNNFLSDVSLQEIYSRIGQLLTFTISFSPPKSCRVAFPFFNRLQSLSCTFAKSEIRANSNIANAVAVNQRGPNWEGKRAMKIRFLILNSLEREKTIFLFFSVDALYEGFLSCAFLHLPYWSNQLTLMTVSMTCRRETCTTGWNVMGR